MAVHINRHRSGFGPGYTAVTRIGEPSDTGIAFGVLKLGAGEVHERATTYEAAYLLMSGEASVETSAARERIRRASLFDELPSAVHVSSGEPLRITSDGAELLVFEVDNAASFPAAIYGPGSVRNEHRGKGRVRNAAYRFVRTIFDGENAPLEAKLVLGEVVNLPGRWSSYPPHHHDQPEIYHYRFTRPEGYGHAELGEDVVKVKAFDTIKILDRRDHAQCAAPGYGMYYAWAIRHLDGRRYTMPELTDEHRWTMEPGADPWWPKDLDER
jgi:5-deoxy-glucuronate isomerase